MKKIFVAGLMLYALATRAQLPSNPATPTDASKFGFQKNNGFGFPRTYFCTGAELKTYIGASGGAVASVFGRMGVVVAASGDYNTSQVTENTNLYFTNERAQAAITANPPLTYSAGVLGSQAASPTQNGHVTNSSQFFAGEKGFNDGIRTSLIKGNNGGPVLAINGLGAAVNCINISAATTGNSAEISLYGDGNLDLNTNGSSGYVNIKPAAGIKLNADLAPIKRFNRTLYAVVYNPAIQHTSSTEADYGSFPIPAGQMAKDGDAMTLEVTGQLLAPVGVNSLAGWFNGTFIFSKTFSGGSTTRSASLFFRVIRTSNTTAVIHVPEPANGQTYINTTNGDLITQTGLNFTTNTYIIKATMAGNGSTSGAALAAVRVLFEPAP